MSISDRLDELDALGEFLNPAESELVHGASTALRAVLDVCDEVSDPATVAGFDVGMVAMAHLVRNAITTTIGEEA